MSKIDHANQGTKVAECVKKPLNAIDANYKITCHRKAHARQHKGSAWILPLKGDQNSAQGFNPELYTQVDGAEHYGGMKIRCGLVAQ